LKVRPEEVVAVEQAIESSDLSLNAYVDDSQSVQYIDTLKANEDAVDEQLARKELKNLFNREIAEFSRTLREREKTILHERLIADTPRTLQNIAEQFEVSREAIRLSEKALITKIKEHMQETFKDVTDFELATSL
jgi:RNA polymerase sigma-32 factor